MCEWIGGQVSKVKDKQSTSNEHLSPKVWLG